VQNLSQRKGNDSYGIELDTSAGEDHPPENGEETNSAMTHVRSPNHVNLLDFEANVF
jgi:hypothetical protein